jgi:high-affinity Fe2+/Pb2+ permease
MAEGGEAIRVVVVEPGWAAWFLVGSVAGLALALVLGSLLFWWERRR